MSLTALPTVVIGAGPVGLAAALHLQSRHLSPVVLEAGTRVGASIREWGHVRLFSPWAYNIDPLAAELLEEQGWRSPDPASYPTGADLVSQYLEPLAATPSLADAIRLGARVTAVSKRQRDRMKDAGRDESPFVVRYTDATGEHEILARAVIDASGTWQAPNPVGASGIPAMGERAVAGHVRYGIPDVLNTERERYAGKRVLVVGSGHSALNALEDLATLRRSAPGTTITWAVRRPSLRRVLGGGENDQLKERGRLGLRIADRIAAEEIELLAAAHIDRLEPTGRGIIAWSDGSPLPAVDEIIAATGFRPDLALLDEVRLDLDPATQSPRRLAPLIDPNQHSCGTVRPHGALELAQPDAGLYIVGMKSYGRAPTFLLLTGYEQVRSVAAAIAGDWEAARRVALQLPETGVCSTQFDAEERAAASCCGAAAPDTSSPSTQDASTCCGGPAPDGVNACCSRDATAKAEGKAGCGCNSVPAAPVLPPATTSCCSRT
ncbi:NAD(P)-binding domain-containing protein [Tahibacter amnicola]|uniref:NAD(P)-binding domain-containing protein n=1 Tax=Tahibacter amnicola TaxID=2976241 RepID=A0ABY6BKK7_9GAMM|nr:NAD(P)-binding domain-containing protein [Tahibacter amnicola]UXI70553.1 NAD(P)-binding domain-containing protein [Tahibacter amnicola]